MSFRQFNTIIIGSGAAGLNCALQLVNKGINAREIAIFTEKIGGGTSFDAGSDKQTYYKMALNGHQLDSPEKMAHTFFDGGAMHGDIALIEATCSTQAFMNLVQLGVPFPHDRYGAFIGYKTDNDPLQRGTSAGPLTSHLMGKALLNAVQKAQIPIFSPYYVLEIVKNSQGEACGIFCVDLHKTTSSSLTNIVQYFEAEHIVLATGGISGIYQNSVYPISQWGGTSLAIQAGATLQNLSESQFGLASLKFRWNVSGTYQQVIPRYISLPQDADPIQDKEQAKEFLKEYFPTTRDLLHAIFLKGYQWPFNAERIENYGSSLIDMAVHIETVEKNRKVYLDYLQNPTDFSFENLSEEAEKYLTKSGATHQLPIDRLKHMNPKAIHLYQEHQIDLFHEPLEIGVCAQHCNGGVTGDIWWQTSIPKLYAVGEVNGSHGIHRPGGAALNSGQVGGYRAAEKIFFTYLNNKSPSMDESDQEKIQKRKNEWNSHIVKKLRHSEEKSYQSSHKYFSINELTQKMQKRMMKCGAYIRKISLINQALTECTMDLQDLNHIASFEWNELQSYLRLLDGLITQHAYLDYIAKLLADGGGSRGSYLVIDESFVESNTNASNQSKKIPNSILQDYPSCPPSEELENKILEQTIVNPYHYNNPDNSLQYEYHWVDCRPIPIEEAWFETVWKQFDKNLFFL